MFKSLTKSVSRSPKQELARLQADYDRGRTKEAIDELRGLAADRPKSAALRVKLAGWLAKAGRRDEAISELFKLQEALSLQGNVLAAISAGLRIVQLDPKFDNPLSYLAKVNAERMKDETTTSSESAAAESGGEQHKSLSEIPFLADLTPEELQGVALGMKQRLLYDGAVVFEHGDASRSLCFVVSGTLEISNEKRRSTRLIQASAWVSSPFLRARPGAQPSSLSVKAKSWSSRSRRWKRWSAITLVYGAFSTVCIRGEFSRGCSRKARYSSS